jgi:DNA helicase II / ATP-dependent DNA helicase PcrA
MEENLFPHARSQNDERQMEEERRLCYVGITRAKERVYLVRAARRLIYGNTSTNPPSRFLLDIPEHLWDSQSSPPRAGMFHRPAFHSPAVDLWTEYDEGAAKPLAQIFQSGDRVRHTIFGTGTVLNSTVTDNDQEVEVEFTSIKGPVVKKLAVSFARLEHL